MRTRKKTTSTWCWSLDSANVDEVPANETPYVRLEGLMIQVSPEPVKRELKDAPDSCTYATTVTKRDGPYVVLESAVSYYCSPRTTDRTIQTGTPLRRPASAKTTGPEMKEQTADHLRRT